MPDANITYDYCKIYDDTFDSTGWRIIHNEPHPIPAWASWIWITILQEATPAHGVLMRNGKRAYTMTELMALFHVKDGKNIACRQFQRAFELLIEQNIITVDEMGVIKVVLAEENYGSETKAAKRKREKRLRAQNCNPENFDESSDSIEGQGGQMSTERPPDVHLPKPPNNNSNNNPQESIRALEHYGEEGEKIDFSENGKLSAGFIAKYPKKPGTAEYAWRIESFVRTLSKAERMALEMAAERRAEEFAQNKLYGGTLDEPLKFAKSRPWTQGELTAAETMIETEILSASLGGGRADAD